MFKNLLILVLSIVLIQYTEAICNKCESNGAACISKTEFHLCYNGIADTSIAYKCLGEDQICTKYTGICKSTVSSSARPGCGDNLYCGQCGDLDGTYACTSRSTFSMCFEFNVTDIEFPCEGNTICDVELANQGEYPCVPKCKENDSEFKMCDLEDEKDEPQTTTVEPTTTTELPKTTTELPQTTTEIPKTTTDVPTITTEKIPASTTTEKVITTTTPKEEVTTAPTTPKPTTTTEKVTTTTEEVTTTTIFSPTPAPITTTTEKETTTTTTPAPTTTELPTTTQNPAELVCSQQNAAGRYPYPNDTTCKKYIYCFWRGGVMQTTFLSCPNELYYDASTSLCTKVKPTGCL